MSPGDPLSELVDALQAGTASKAIQWEQADARGSAFIARRPSGTVTLEGQRGRSPVGALAIEPATVRLVVKDATGKTVEQYDAVEQSALALAVGGIGAMMKGATPDSRLVSLWWEVREQLTKAESTMRKLAKEFEAPE
ncbi:MAG TPA: hypothetical protein VNZ01_10210 [Solirubrobacteraceae bacterium]|jgi:hypothetical protein|nr:hypothetical protein [Solirubrobacteraceae bacterium]